MELQLMIVDGKIENNVDKFCEDTAIALKSKNYVVTEENYTDAKADRAKLNKVLEAVKRRRIDFEKEIVETFQPSKEKLMANEKEILKVINNLDEGIKAKEDKEKEEKKQQIIEYFNSLNFTSVPLEKLFDEKWLNKGCKEKEWKENLLFKTREIENGLKTIDLLGDDEYSVLVKSFYIHGTVFSNEGIGIAKGLADKQLETISKIEPKPKKHIDVVVKEQPKAVLEEETEELSSFSILTTPTKKWELIEFMKQKNIKFRKTKKEDLEEK